MNGKSPVVLSIDAGFEALGWVVARLIEIDRKMSIDLVAVGVIRTKKDTKKKHIYVADDDCRRIKELITGLRGVLDVVKIDGIVAEIPSGGAQGARANRCMGMSTAIVICFAEMLNVPIETYTPNEVKKVMTGKITASKEAMVAGAQAEWPDTKWPKNKGDIHHAADAAATLLAAEANGNLLKMLYNSAKLRP
ncbi:hypothetical protein LCGC14_1614830 [marine sediment metagenome]|uniref:Uncharacterized protein n=1 Tax=marine sediment metagenome TaxID=412755 RepID=A0A0F9I775_9ZZZZ